MILRSRLSNLHYVVLVSYEHVPYSKSPKTLEKREVLPSYVHAFQTEILQYTLLLTYKHVTEGS
jgi:hypothetical protein